MPRQPRSSSKKGKAASAVSTAVVPYAGGFKPPTAKQIQHAIGFDGCIPNEFDPGDFVSANKCTFYKSIPQPSSIDDWLAQYNEQGQTYKQFVNECPWMSSRKRKYLSQEFLPSGQTLLQKYPEGKVYIVPIGDFEGTKFYASLVDYTHRFLGLPVVCLPGVKLEAEDGKVFWVDEPDSEDTVTSRRKSRRTKRHQLNSRYNIHTEHLQICVDSNLLKLQQKIPSDAICIIGLTMYDMYADESDLFVAGMAAGNQRVAVFSLFRYDPCLSFSVEHWFQSEEVCEMAEVERQRIILQRSCKLLVHEICHLLGVAHCVYFDCCMNGSGHLAEDFRQPMHLCPVDLHKLQTLVGFDVGKRYESLLEFYRRELFKEEQEWVAKRIEFLKQ